MPLVFVHGVSVRKEDPTYHQSELMRDELFRRLTLANIVPGIDPDRVQIFNPYWGDKAATLAWNGASLPNGHAEAFGPASDVVARLTEQAVIELRQDTEPGDYNELLPTLARRRDLARAVDLLWPSAALSKLSSDSGAKALARQMGLFATAVVDYAKSNPHPGWLRDVRTNEEFSDRLLAAAQGARAPQPQGADEGFGVQEIWQAVKDGAKLVTTAAAAALTNPVVSLVRPSINDKATLFLGDAFCYLTARERHGSASPIVQSIASTLRKASEARTSTDPLLLVGHSMGGNILYDMLTTFVKGEITCDFFLSVGSQVGLFEELKLFAASKANTGDNKVPKPPNVGRWLNVFDRADVFSYSASSIFNEVEEYEYSSGETVVQAHGAYLLQPRFHERLNARLRRAP